MNKIEHKIDNAIKQAPDYSRLHTLSHDVRSRVRDARQLKYGNYTIPPVLKIATLMLSVLAFVATVQVVQVSFQTDSYQADLFDLRFFSHQSIPSLNLASVNTYEYLP